MSRHAETFPSGFRWADGDSGIEGRKITLISPSGKPAADVFTTPYCGLYAWFVCDEGGWGGENSAEGTIPMAKQAAESAVLRAGKHFMPNKGA